MSRLNESTLLKQAHQHLDKGEIGPARELFERVAKINRRSVPARTFLAHIAIHECRFDAAMTYIKECEGLMPRRPEPLTLQGDCYTTMGDFDSAIRSYDRALRISQDFMPALSGKAYVLTTQERWSDTKTMLEPVLDRLGEDPALVLVLARIHRQEKQYEQGIALLEAHLDDADNQDQRRLMHHELGAMHERNGQYDLAFARHREANELFGRPWSAESDRERIESLISFFDTDTLAAIPRAEHDTRQPIFIVGMPRSGSTLVEQILSSHPDVYGAGEIYFMPELVNDLNLAIGSIQVFPECVRDLDQEDVNQLSRRYLDALAALNPSTGRITDKYLDNFEFIGILTALLPQARIIHTRRHPLDTCLSCFFQKFAQSFPGYTLDLRALGTRYSHYWSLMDHWRSLPGIEMLEIEYAEMVHDQITTTRRLLEFCGLPWDDRCLEYYKSERIVITLSREQVNKPIYTSSLDRYRNYQVQLEPLKEALREGGVPFDDS